ncbi:(MFS) transporter [Geosmithia morbida]|uniref:(MFS) transporter n=1 Tax=Geosmithia morbida TaxID=1094350 RepID=A0A9P5D7X4_9HYPO|nr:(MFS) transporter [Geosmithia morbida]KAF4124954.1 (MFS) transporter [Geosmithia morbida]
MIWAPYATTKAQWIANKVLQGFVGAPIESLCEISVSDVYFTHERGTYLGVYSFALLGSNFFAPLISGFINDGQGWKWVLFWCAIFCGGGFIICFLFMEETNYIRAPLIVTEAEECRGGDEAAGGAAAETKDTAGGEKETKQTAASPCSGSDVEGNTEALPLRSTKTWRQKMRLYASEHGATNSQILGMVTRPLVLFTFPAVLFSGFMYGSVLCYFNVLNGTASLVLSEPPYSFSSSMVGLTYISCIAGTVIGTLYSGILGDRLLLWKARRNRGVMEAEHRLWLYASLLVATPAGLILWGVGAAHEVHWFGPVFAMAMLGASCVVGCQVPIAYCIDAYKDLSADAMVTVICIRNTMSFAIGYGITPWVTNMGYQNAFIVCAFASLAQLSLFLVFIKWGKRLREASRPRYLKFLEDVEKEGNSH